MKNPQLGLEVNPQTAAVTLTAHGRKVTVYQDGFLEVRDVRQLDLFPKVQPEQDYQDHYQQERRKLRQIEWPKISQGDVFWSAGRPTSPFDRGTADAVEMPLQQFTVDPTVVHELDRALYAPLRHQPWNPTGERMPGAASAEPNITGAAFAMPSPSHCYVAEEPNCGD